MLHERTDMFIGLAGDAVAAGFYNRYYRPDAIFVWLNQGGDFSIVEESLRMVAFNVHRSINTVSRRVWKWQKQAS